MEEFKIPIKDMFPISQLYWKIIRHVHIRDVFFLLEFWGSNTTTQVKKFGFRIEPHMQNFGSRIETRYEKWF